MERLRELRKSKQLTQEKLAREIGVNRSNIADWELGRSEPSIEFIIRLARYFDQTTDYLLANDTEHYVYY